MNPKMLKNSCWKVRKFHEFCRFGGWKIFVKFVYRRFDVSSKKFLMLKSSS